MKSKSSVAGLLLLLATTAFTRNPHTAPNNKSVTAIVDAAVIPMTSETVLRHQTVLISGETIIAVGPVDRIEVPSDALKISGTGLYLMPGLVDSHVHLEKMLGARPELGDAPLFLASGVTTVFNLRGSPEHLRWRQLIQSGQLLAPNLYTSGDFINEPRINTPAEAEREVLQQVHDGYDLLKIHEVFGPDFRPTTTSGLSRPTYDRLLATARASHIPVVGHLPAELGLIPALEEHQNLAHIVMYLLGYFLPLETRTFQHWMITGLASLAGLMFLLVLMATAAVVRKWRGRVAPGTQGDRRRKWIAVWLTLLAFVLAATYYSLQWLGRTYLISILTACSVITALLTILLIIETAKMLGRGSSRLQIFPFAVWSFAAVTFTSSLFYFVHLSWRSTRSNVEAIARDSADAKIVVMTTLVVEHTHEMAQDPSLHKLSRMARDYWGVDDGSMASEGWLDRLFLPAFRHFQQQIAGSLHRAGVPLLAGTDTFGFPGVAPGISLHKELELLRKSGLTPYEALRTATVNPAAFLDQSNKFGQIVPGQRADLLLVKGNPLENLEALKKLRGVVLRGKWLDDVEIQNEIAALPD